MLLEHPPTAPPGRLTADDLERLPDGDRYELVGGELVEKAIDTMSSWVGVTVAAALHQHCGTTGQGLVFNGECGYRLFPERPDLVRKPDVSVVARPRLPGGKIPTGFFALAPDLAVEVISPRDLFYEVAGKVADYLAAGVRQVWVLNPEQRTVTVHTPARVTHLGAPDTLEAGELLPGFQCRVADLFPPVEEETG